MNFKPDLSSITENEILKVNETLGHENSLDIYDDVMKDMMLDSGTMSYELSEDEPPTKKSDSILDFDPVALAVQGTKKGSRYSVDGTPLLLKAFLESANPALNFQFRFKEKTGQLIPLDEEYDRRVIGKRMRFVMYDGEFRKPDQYTLPTIPEGNNRRYKISDVYLLQIDPDIVMYAGLLPGWKVPFITDGNPHQEGLLDQKRVIYLPYSEDKNLVMELPNAPGLLFISQLISSGGEIIFALDKVVHKYWVIAIHQVYTPPKYLPNNLKQENLNGCDEALEDRSWRRAIENQAYCDRILQLLTELGHNLEIVLRISPATAYFKNLSYDQHDSKHPAQQRLDNYFRDEINSSNGQIRHYYYEKEALVYGFYEENDWKFGLKDRGQNNGYSIKVSSLKALYVTTSIATYPL